MTKSRQPSVRHEKNPFIENMVIPIKTAKVQLSRLGKDDNILVNQATGEVSGTHVTTYRKVDKEEFVKLFTRNIALIFDLKSSGIKVFNVLVWVLQEKSLGKDLIPLDQITLATFLEAHEDLKMSVPTFSRGLAELETAKIIAKAVRKGWYYINPNFIFNGDRIAFSTVIQREQDDARRKFHENQEIDFFG